MKNSKLFNMIQERTKDLQKSKSSKFNTNDFLLEILLDQEIERDDVVLMVLEKRLRDQGIDENHKDFPEACDKLYKTSKNGVDTSVSDSNNNSSFSYNEKYNDYKLIKKGSKLKIVRRDVK